MWLAALRGLKLLSVCLLFAGTVGTFATPTLTSAERFAYRMAGPGFALVYLAGFGLAYLTGVSPLSIWVVASIVLSIVSLQVVLFAVGREGRRGPVTAAIAILPLCACVFLMTFRAWLG